MYTMKHMNIGIGTDHRGFSYIETIRLYAMIGDIEITWHDFGAFSDERTDYPLYAHKVAQAVADKQIDAGLLLCGTGVGMAITANRYKGIYAAVAWNAQIARQAREDDNSNILVIPTEHIGPEQVHELLHAWLTAKFKGGRYEQRLQMIDNPCT